MSAGLLFKSEVGGNIASQSLSGGVLAKMSKKLGHSHGKRPSFAVSTPKTASTLGLKQS